jgi:hypothetical protein
MSRRSAFAWPLLISTRLRAASLRFERRFRQSDLTPGRTRFAGVRFRISTCGAASAPLLPPKGCWTARRETCGSRESPGLALSTGVRGARGEGSSHDCGGGMGRIPPPQLRRHSAASMPRWRAAGGGIEDRCDCMQRKALSIIDSPSEGKVKSAAGETRARERKGSRD